MNSLSIQIPEEPKSIPPITSSLGISIAQPPDAEYSVEESKSRANSAKVANQCIKRARKRQALIKVSRCPLNVKAPVSSNAHEDCQKIIGKDGKEEL